jgi:hypothetical protein
VWASENKPRRLSLDSEFTIKTMLGEMSQARYL